MVVEEDNNFVVVEVNRLDLVEDNNFVVVGEDNNFVVVEKELGRSAEELEKGLGMSVVVADNLVEEQRVAVDNFVVAVGMTRLKCFELVRMDW